LSATAIAAAALSALHVEQVARGVGGERAHHRQKAGREQRLEHARVGRHQSPTLP
jgi:hypothetical protein